MRNLRPADFGVAGRVVVITGASSRLGSMWARALAAAGARVVMSAAREDELHAVAQRVTGDGGVCHAVACDVTRPEDVAALMATATRHFGRIDVLVANAGAVGDAGPMHGRPPRELLGDTVRANLQGMWFCARDAGTRMLAQRSGSIIMVSAAVGPHGERCFPPAHQATVSAMANMARNLALSWIDRGVRVNALAPGALPGEASAPFTASPHRAGVPPGRPGDPDDLIGPLQFLASDASRHINGQTLVVDGGISASLGHTGHDDGPYEFHAAMTPGGTGGWFMTDM